MQYFTIEELTKSDTAKKRGIVNVPSETERLNLIALVGAVLDPLRERYGRPIYVNSGYRCAALNKAVGGVATSQHVKGEAADISGGSKRENRRLAKLIVEMGLPFDQLIDEQDYAWLHVSFRRTADNRRNLLRYKDRRYTFIKPEEL